MCNAPRMPIPNSWYGVAFSDQLPAGTLLSRKLAGHDLIVYRTESGRVNVADAFCPHLGAHFGYGGTVEGEELRCPFHGFRYDCQGVCTATGYATKPPKKAHLRVWPVEESNGIIWVYYDSQGLAPTWKLTVYDSQGWTPLVYKILPLRDHPLETVENGIDIGHFAIVHGYTEVEQTRDFSLEGPIFRVGYAATRPRGVYGKLGANVRFVFDLTIHGLGFSLVKTTVPQFGIEGRLFVLATPTEDDRIDLHVAMSVKEVEPKGINPLLAFFPRRAVSQIISRSILSSVVHDIGQDSVIWENKKYLESPALAEGDGPIGKYRLWARQFFHDERESAQAPALPIGAD